MFEPLPDVIRLRRVKRNLTQQQLANLAGVSRWQLVNLERGKANVSLQFLLKVAKVLELTELPVGALRLRAAPPHFPALVAAADAVAIAKQIIGQVTGAVSQLDDADASLSVLMERALSSAGSVQPIGEAADRLAATPAAEHGRVAGTLRELAESAEPRARARRTKPVVKTAVRRRSR